MRGVKNEKFAYFKMLYYISDLFTCWMSHAQFTFTWPDIKGTDLRLLAAYTHLRNVDHVLKFYTVCGYFRCMCNVVVECNVCEKMESLGMG